RRSVRALLPGVPVRAVGREDGAGSHRRRHSGMRGSGVKPPIILIGAGRMGGAMLRGWIARGLGPVIAVEPKPAASLPKLKGVRLVAAIEDIPSGRIRACVIALKPQILRTEAVRLKPIAAQGTTMVSIAAGTCIATLTKALGRGANILR